jgi:hypothetical protein
LRARAARLQQSVSVVQGDALRADLRPATVLYMFLQPRGAGHGWQLLAAGAELRPGPQRPAAAAPLRPVEGLA